ncbi:MULTISPECIES: cupin [unclassified Mesorhizobium]|uniref:cupin n=1 Tax=unclassified Mesorhizobium TaxID=325217 RepID=UPI00112BFC36|nr:MULTISPECIES: cupin [unclassified Mesorhizobium]MBZ9701666.1 cupin [Mesorhizobium sp. CO1-1-3]MBZ9949014.1 cupin [Mesorhizobium sp. BR1-1-11]TPI99530.1 cupin [Mesorhizobium sp. B2-8-1]
MVKIRARQIEPLTFRFDADDLVPNHPRWPMLVYPGAVTLPDDIDPASVFEDIFRANGWGACWRNGIFDHVHYHSRIHEVLGIASGSAKVRFGGDRGEVLNVKAGDVAILPAGTGHQRLSSSAALLVVGAYPPFGTYDLCTTAGQLKTAQRIIPKVGRPETDPVYGAGGPLLEAWQES